MITEAELQQEHGHAVQAASDAWVRLVEANPGIGIDRATLYLLSFYALGVLRAALSALVYSGELFLDDSRHLEARAA